VARTLGGALERCVWLPRADVHSGSTGLGRYFSSQLAAIHPLSERRGSIALRNDGRLGAGNVPITLP